MKNLSTFQLITLGIFVVLIIVGAGIFAAFGGILGGTSVGKVVVWGTLDQGAINNVLEVLRSGDGSFESVTYVQKKPDTYAGDLLSAMASGAAPDLFLTDSTGLGAFADKVLTIPYGTVSQSSFESAFIDEGKLFETSQGVLALPLTIDPLVMYSNRDLFATAGVASPPQYWNDFLTLSPKITSLGGTDVKRSAVALGTWQNVVHAKEILSTLFMQAGDPIVVRLVATTENPSGPLMAVLGGTPQGSAEGPAQAALRFYTEFANPSKTDYSWNAALPRSTDAFTSGTLAVYFGFASEYQALLAKNPNLPVAVSVMPQLQGSGTHQTFGRLTGLAIPKISQNPQGALTIAQKLTGQKAIALLSPQIQLPPVRRDISVDASANAAASVFAQSALISRAWHDPNPAVTDSLFKTMIESVISGKSSPAQAVGEAAAGLSQLLQQH